jgi:MFS family permease
MWESKFAPLSGPLFAVLLVARFVVDPNTDFMPPEAEVVAYLQDGPIRIMTGAYLGLLAAASLLWFSGTVYRSLDRDDHTHRLAAIALGGGVCASSLLTVGAVTLIAGAERVAMTGDIDPGAAAALFDVSGIAVGNGAVIGLAVLIGAWGLGSLIDRRRPRWHGWASLLIALGLVTPFAWAVLAGALVWVAVLGTVAFRESARQISRVA